jgi:hypothetical protein
LPSPNGIVVLNNSGHDPGGIFAEVYDDSQPAARLDVAAVEALSAWSRVWRPSVGTSDSPHDHVDVIE